MGIVTRTSLKATLVTLCDWDATLASVRFDVSLTFDVGQTENHHLEVLELAPTQLAT